MITEDLSENLSERLRWRENPVSFFSVISSSFSVFFSGVGATASPAFFGRFLNDLHLCPRLLLNDLHLCLSQDLLCRESFLHLSRRDKIREATIPVTVKLPEKEEAEQEVPSAIVVPPREVGVAAIAPEDERVAGSCSFLLSPCQGALLPKLQAPRERRSLRRRRECLPISGPTENMLDGQMLDQKNPIRRWLRCPHQLFQVQPTP